MHIQVKKLSRNVFENICLLPEKIFDTFKLSTEVIYNLHIGQLNTKSFIKPYKEKDNYMYFSRPIFNKLLLYSDASLNIWNQDKDIYLGPVVGVFVKPSRIRAIENGNLPEFAKKHMQANEEAHCLTYFFSIEKINWIDKKFKGYTFIPSLNKWKYYWFSIPDVIYDRGVGFKDDEWLLARHIRLQFDYDPNIKFINSRDYLGKWQLHRHLSKYPEINEFLPKTIRYTNFNDVLMMLKEYNFIFIKSSFGSRGRDVLSIEQEAKQYRLIFYENRLKEVLFEEIYEVRKYIEDFIKEKQYIIQQGIRLLKYQGHNMDMRVLVEKDGSGKWKSIYNQSRIARENSTITNCSVGGDIANYEEIYPELKNLLCKGNIPNNDEIENVTLKIATFIEKEYGSFGELGMDMAVDNYGKIWFIEANSKPDINPEPGLEDIEGISPQFLATLEYAKFLVKGEGNNE